VRFVTFSSRDCQPPVPNGCPVCGLAMLCSSDVSAYEQFACCHQCEMRWAEARRTAWAGGWRPSAEDVRAFVAELRAVPFTIPRLV
jgi:hypothetical protein